MISDNLERKKPMGLLHESYINNAIDIFIRNDIAIILYQEDKGKEGLSYSVLGLNNNMKSFLHKDLDKDKAIDIYNEKVNEYR